MGKHTGARCECSRKAIFTQPIDGLLRGVSLSSWNWTMACAQILLDLSYGPLALSHLRSAQFNEKPSVNEPPVGIADGRVEHKSE